MIHDDQSRLVAAWDEHSRIHVATDKTSDWHEAIVSAEDKSASHPLLTATRHGVQVFWTERDVDGKRRWAMARLPADETEIPE